MNRWNVAAVLMLPLLAIQAQTQSTPQMFIWQNGNLAPLMNSEGVSCDHWSIWVFSDGTSPIPGQQWGAITGASPGEVQGKWQQALEQQRESDAILKQHGNHLMGYGTHLGPICIAGRQSRESSLDSSKAEDLFNQVADKLTWAYVQIRQRAATPTELSQYIENLQMIEQRVQKIRSWLETTDSANYASIEQALNQATQQFANADSRLPVNLRGGSPGSQQVNAGGGSAPWSGKTVYTRGGDNQIIGSSAITLTDSGVHVVKTQIFNGNPSATFTNDVTFNQIANCNPGYGMGGAFSASLVLSTPSMSQTTYSGGMNPTSSPAYNLTLWFESQADMQNFVNFVNQHISH